MYLLIAAPPQGNGDGRTTVQLALEFIQTFSCGKADWCRVSYASDNTAARNLYHSAGFCDIGQKVVMNRLPRFFFDTPVPGFLQMK